MESIDIMINEINEVMKKEKKKNLILNVTVKFGKVHFKRVLYKIV